MDYVSFFSSQSWPRELSAHCSGLRPIFRVKEIQTFVSFRCSFSCVPGSYRQNWTVQSNKVADSTVQLCTSLDSTSTSSRLRSHVPNTAPHAQRPAHVEAPCNQNQAGNSVRLPGNSSMRTVTTVFLDACYWDFGNPLLVSTAMRVVYKGRMSAIANGMAQPRCGAV